MFKRTIVAITILAAILCLTVKVDAAKPTQWLIYWYVCGTDIETTRIAFKNGTDLMSDNPKALILDEPDRQPGDATRSIKEVEKANLSPDVKIFMQAGGTYIWGHEKFHDLNAKIQTKAKAYYKDKNGKFVPIEGTILSSNSINVRQWFLTKANGDTVAVPVQYGKIGRYVYNKDHRNWHAREKLSIITGTTSLEDGTIVTVPAPNTETDMGSKEGFISFLKAGQKLEQELYPDGNVRRILILKDHGNYDGAEICSDEYTKHMIHVNEINQAFKDVQGNWANPEEKPFEAVVFDACVMSTYETAVALEDVANYMVASQEVTWRKGNMDYTALLNELSKNPLMNGKDLGKIICNTGLETTKVVDKEFGTNANATFTLSVIDLSEQKMDALKTAYAKFSATATKIAQENYGDVATFAKFKNAANVAERYPSDKPTITLVDLKNFSDNLGATVPELKEAANDLGKALDNCVVYNKRGDVLNRGGGLSEYLPATFYGTLQNNMQDKSVDLSGLKDTAVEVDEEKKIASIEISEEYMKIIGSVRYQVAYLKPYSDADGNEKLAALVLGSDNAVKENLKANTFESAFNGKWITFEGKPLFVQIVSDATQKNKNGKKVKGNDICVTPVLINNEAYKLYFARSYPSGKITLIGAVSIPEKGSENLLPDSNLKSLKKGDVVVPLYGQINRSVEEIENAKSGNDMLEWVKGTPITIGNKPKVETSTLIDGLYFYGFYFVSPINDNEFVAPKSGVVFKLKNGSIVGVKSVEDLEDFSDLEEFDAQ